MFEGANFNLRITKKDKMTNYDSSSFGAKSAVADGDEALMEEIFNKCKPLQPLIKKIEHTDLKKRLNKVMGVEDEIPQTEAKPQKEKVIEEDISNEVPFESDAGTASNDEEDVMSFFDDLANS